MQLLVPGQVLFNPLIIIIVAIAAIILLLLFMKVYQARHAAGKKDRPGTRNGKLPGDSITPLHGTPEKRHGKLSEKKQPGVEVPFADPGDISKNLQAIVSKYHLIAITLSTTDGLVIASTSEFGPEDAANYGNALKPGDTLSVPGIRLFSIGHKGSAVIGIVRSGDPITDILLGNIRNDTEKIMDWCI